MRNEIIKSGFVAGLLLMAAACNNGKLSKETAEKENILPAPQEMEISVSEDSLKSILNYLASDELKGRMIGTEGIEKAAQRIENIFRNNNIKPYFETYRDSFEVKGKPVYNIVGVVEGEDPELKDEFVIVGAHYDHIGQGKEVNGDVIANGANDNAAGTVAVVELAKKFASVKDNRRSLMFVLFSAEEEGLLGSKHIAKRLKAEGLDLYTMLAFEMIGVPMQDKEYLTYITGFNTSNMAEKLNEYSGEEVVGFLPQAAQYNLFNRSDNQPFYEQFQVPAQAISTFDFTNYDFYHHVSDEASEMDIAHMAEVVETIFPAIHAMVNTEEQEIKLNEEELNKDEKPQQ